LCCRQATDAGFWAGICPGLTVCAAKPSKKQQKQKQPTAATTQCARAGMLRDGFFTAPPATMGWSPELVKALGEGVLQLVAAGWPAAFILAFDEAWELIHCASSFLGEVTHTMNNFDILGACQQQTPRAQSTTVPPSARVSDSPLPLPHVPGQRGASTPLRRQAPPGPAPPPRSSAAASRRTATASPKTSPARSKRAGTPSTTPAGSR
jgi:hypothetical protein